MFIMVPLVWLAAKQVLFTASPIKLLDFSVMNQHYHKLMLWGNTGIIVHQKATGTKGFTLTLFFVSSPVMNLPKLLRNRSAELSCEQQKATSAGMVHRGGATGSLETVDNGTTLWRETRLLPHSLKRNLNPMNNNWILKNKWLKI